MAINSRDKGGRGERELAAKLSEIFSLKCRRGQQFRGGPDSPDVVGVPGLHFECKRTERFNLYAAVDQAAADCGENIPVVAHRRNKREWVVVLKMDDLMAAAKLLNTFACSENDAKMGE